MGTFDKERFLTVFTSKFSIILNLSPQENLGPGDVVTRYLYNTVLSRFDYQYSINGKPRKFMKKFVCKYCEKAFAFITVYLNVIFVITSGDFNKYF